MSVMGKRNYYKELEELIAAQRGNRPSLLLHSCCGPCSSSVLEFLTKYFEVTLLWYNPNLFPESEYFKRLDAQRELLGKMPLSSVVDILIEPWRHEEFLSVSNGLEEEPEGGKRCEQCFLLRLRECARIAKEKEFDYFCSTLTVSRYKNTETINTVGEMIAKEIGVSWLPSDFKKKGGEQRSTELAVLYRLYRQVYCGCEYSLQNRKDYEETGII